MPPQGGSLVVIMALHDVDDIIFGQIYQAVLPGDPARPVTGQVSLQGLRLSHSL